MVKAPDPYSRGCPSQAWFILYSAFPTPPPPHTHTLHTISTSQWKAKCWSSTPSSLQWTVWRFSSWTDRCRCGCEKSWGLLLKSQKFKSSRISLGFMMRKESPFLNDQTPDKDKNLGRIYILLLNQTSFPFKCIMHEQISNTVKCFYYLCVFSKLPSLLWLTGWLVVDWAQSTN